MSKKYRQLYLDIAFFTAVLAIILIAICAYQVGRNKARIDALEQQPICMCMEVEE